MPLPQTEETREMPHAGRCECLYDLISVCPGNLENNACVTKNEAGT